MTFAPEFVRVARKELLQGCDRVGSCLDRLSTEQIWHRDHAVENSVGNLVLHVSGNMRQWIVSGIGGEEDLRQRDQEFATREQLEAGELKRHLAEAVADAETVLEALTDEGLLQRRHIQVYDVTVLHAVIHVLTHYAGHVGQIIWITKHLTGQDLAFYGYLKKGGAVSGQAP